MAIELAALRSFLALADHLHFGEASKVLKLTQPALTKQIQKLEANVGGKLLLRGHKRITLTSAGVVLRDRAHSLLREAEMTETMTRLATRGHAGRLRIGFGIAVLASGLPDVVLHFRKRFPNVQITMSDRSTPTQIEMLEQGDIDVGFVRLPMDHSALATIPLLEEHLVVALPQGMSFEKGLHGLRDAPFIVLERSVSSSFYDHVARTCRSAGFEPHIAQEVSETLTALNLVRAGAGVSLVPSSVAMMNVPNVQLLNIRQKEAKWKIGIAWRKKLPLDPLTQSFIQTVRRSFRTQPTIGHRKRSIPSND